MPRFTLFLICMLFAALGQAHEAESTNPELEAANRWTEERLQVEYDSPWSTEHCVNAPEGRVLTYEFDADAATEMNFHLHPARNGEYHTVNIENVERTRKGSGRIRTEETGQYCFDFPPSEQQDEDWEIRLRYRME